MKKITLPSPGAKLTSVQWSPEYVATTVSIERATSTDGLLRWTVDGSLDSDGVAPQAAALRPVRMAYQSPTSTDSTFLSEQICH